MRKHPTAIVLGGTSPHIALIENLKTRGYYTVLVDYLENPPARNAADEHIRESTLDQDKVLELARTIDAKLVISTCVDQANVTACYVAERLGLPAPYSYETALNVTNKILMKKKMIESGIPTSRFVIAKSFADFENQELRFPVIVKPADSCASTGVKKAFTPSEVEIFLNDALGLSRTNGAVVEEFNEGREFSVYGFVKEKKVHLILIAQRITTIDGSGRVMLCYATVAPAEITEKLEYQIQECADKIAASFDLNNTPIHIQVITNGDEIDVIEFAPRVGGGFSYKTIKLGTGFDIINAAVDSYLNIKTNIEYKKPDSVFAINLIYATPGIFDRIEGYGELIENNTILGLFDHKTRGSRICSDRASSSRVGAILVEGKSRHELLAKIEHAVTRMEVYDSNGKRIMRKDLYLKNTDL